MLLTHNRRVYGLSAVRLCCTPCFCLFAGPPKGLPNPTDIVPAVCSGCQLCYPFYLGLWSAAAQSRDLLTHAVSFYSQHFILGLTSFVSEWIYYPTFIAQNSVFILTLVSRYTSSCFVKTLYSYIVLAFRRYSVLNICCVNVISLLPKILIFSSFYFAVKI